MDITNLPIKRTYKWTMFLFPTVCKSYVESYVKKKKKNIELPLQNQDSTSVIYLAALKTTIFSRNLQKKFFQYGALLMEALLICKS